MNHYETVFILTPVLSDAQVKETVEAVKAELEKDGEGAVVKKLETYFRRQDRVIRFITVKNDKYAAEYAAKRRSLKAPKTEEA